MTPDRREAARIRQQRSRDRRRDAARLRAIAEAQRLEQEAAAADRFAEQLAPFVMRNPVVTQAGVMLIGPRIEIRDGRPARVDPVASLKLTVRQRKAGLQIQADWREVGAGLNVAAAGYLRGSGQGGGMGGHAAMRRQIDTRARLDGALTFLGAFAPVVARVVLDCVPPAVWACQEGRPAEDAAAWVTAALTRLAGFYWPEPPAYQGAPIERILTIGPPRQAYSVEHDAVDLL
jgi:hypothetical protein